MSGRSLSPIRVLIADDHAMVRQGLRVLIEAQDGWSVVAEASNGQEALQLARSVEPDIVILDVRMPPMGGVEAAARLVADCPGTRILALTMHEERGYISRMLAAGVHGYLLKRAAASELVAALQTVARGERYLDPAVAATHELQAAGNMSSATGVDALPAKLTPREREIAELLARGYSNKEIAQSLAISVKTVEAHRTNAMAKLGLNSRAALVRFAVAEGWIS